MNSKRKIKTVLGIKDVFGLSEFINPKDFIPDTVVSNKVKLESLIDKTIAISKIEKLKSTKFKDIEFYYKCSAIVLDDNRTVIFTTSAKSVSQQLDALIEKLNLSGIDENEIPYILCTPKMSNRRLYLLTANIDQLKPEIKKTFFDITESQKEPIKEEVSKKSESNGTSNNSDKSVTNKQEQSSKSESLYDMKPQDIDNSDFEEVDSDGTILFGRRR